MNARVQPTPPVNLSVCMLFSPYSCIAPYSWAISQIQVLQLSYSGANWRSGTDVNNIFGSTGMLTNKMVMVKLITSLQNLWIYSHSHTRSTNVPRPSPHSKRVSGTLLLYLLNLIGVMYCTSASTSCIKASLSWHLHLLLRPFTSYSSIFFWNALL